MRLVGTPGQLQALDAYIQRSSFKEAAAGIGLSERVFRRRMDELRHLNEMTLVELVACRGIRKAA